MTDWRAHLTPEEAERVAAIAREIAALRREHRKHFDRARKRAIRKLGVNVHTGAEKTEPTAGLDPATT